MLRSARPCFLARARLLAAASLLCILLPCASSAVAATGHGFLYSVREAGPGSPLGEPGALAVERSSGRVFLADPGTGTVEEFSSSGAFEGTFGEGLEATGVAVDESTHDVYVTDSFSDSIDVFKPGAGGGYQLLSEWSGAGTPTGEFGEVRGVAVDNSHGASAGDVYVVDSAGGVVDVFKPKAAGPEEAEEGEFVRTLSGAKLEEPNAVTVDPATGKVLVADSPKGVVDIYGASGALEGKLTGAGSPQGSFRGSEGDEGNVSAVAVDEATGDVYVAESERHVVSEFNASREWIGWVTGIPEGPFGAPDGVALAPTGEVYVTDAGQGRLDAFGPGVAVPDVKSNAASKVAKTSAVLNGVINGDGKPSKYHFEWGQGESYGNSTPSSAAGSGEEKASTVLEGLQPGATYHFRLVGEDENGTDVGADREFTTRPAVEALSTGPAQGIAPTAATLTGSLNPSGVQAYYYFEWGPTNSYGNDQPMQPGTSAGSGGEAVAATTELTGLRPNTVYHYRLVGTDTFGTTRGEDRQFTTSGPPRITKEPTSGLGHEAATINAKVDPDALASEYHFEYGKTTAYGTEVPLGGGKLAAGEAPVAVSATLSGLEIGVTYHFRVVAGNSAGTTVGPDQVFTTIPPALIESESAVEVKATTATLQAQINPLGHDTTYYFQYGPASCRATPDACTDVPSPPGADIGAGEVGQPVSAPIAGLQAGTAYHFRVLAINSLGTAEGSERTITTPEERLSALADKRAWELVSPPNKHGAPIEPLTREGGLIVAAESGSALTYVTNGSIVEEPQGNRSPEMQQAMSTRGPQGWSSADVATPSSKAEGISGGQAPEYQFFTPDLASALVEPWGTTEFSEPPLAPEATQRTMYARNDTTGAFLPLVTGRNVPSETIFGGRIHFLDASPDLRHVVLRSDVALTAPPSGRGSTSGAKGHCSSSACFRGKRRRPKRNSGSTITCSLTLCPTTARASSGPRKKNRPVPGICSCAARSVAGRSSSMPRRESSNRRKARLSSRPPTAMPRGCSSPTSSA